MDSSRVHMHTAICMAICVDMCGACSRLVCHHCAEEQLEAITIYAITIYAIIE